jgi:hypothetical protein
LESIRNFNVRAKVVGPTVSVRSFDVGASHEPSTTGHVRQIYPARNGDSCADKRPRVRICGPGNGEGVRRAYAYSHNVRPSPGVLSCFDTPPLSSGPEDGQVARAKALTDDLLEVVRGEYAKVKTMLHQQQMELHQAQMQYASYGMMGVRILNTGRSSVLFHLLLLF